MLAAAVIKKKQTDKYLLISVTQEADKYNKRAMVIRYASLVCVTTNEYKLKIMQNYLVRQAARSRGFILVPY